jgi:hypothetical protein
MTGVAPLQWNVSLSPDTCGKRPVATWGLQTGLKPVSSASRSCAPVSVRITVRLPNGSTANTSPHVISPGASPALGGVTRRSARRPRSS